ncbi:MAG TPA: very short patch repair endonuclease [Baekduia sp.]|nr:very short patch repair endonuclease [Baekduia sp.]
MTEDARTRDELLVVVREAPAASSPTVRALMQRNRRRDSRAEVQLRRALHAMGLRFRVDHPIRCGRGRPIRADVVFTRARVAVFVDGCFWHGCPQHGRTPKSNTGYWEAKVALNRDRDRRQRAALTADGWKVLRIWEHEPAVEAAKLVSETVRRR